MDIVGQDAPVLRHIAAEVAIEDIKTPKIQRVIRKMQGAVFAQEDGVAIAAPQIGASLRLFVVAPRAFEKEREHDNLPQETEPRPAARKEHTVYINPRITKISKTHRWMDEGCLSVRWLYGKVHRATKVTVRAYDERGKTFERGASGLLAQIFQHETDHLDGILFIDKAKDIVDLPPDKQHTEKI